MFVPLQLNKGNLQRLLASFTSGIVTSWSGGTTGLTPVPPTGGAVVLAGTLGVPNGGTGSTTSTGTAASGVVLRDSPTIDTTMTVSGAPDVTAFRVIGRLNNSAVVVNVVDFNITATNANTSSQVVRVTSGAAASTVVAQLDTLGNMELAGYAAIGRASSLTQGGALALGAYFGTRTSGTLGVFGGIGSPTFNPLGRAGGLYLNATTTAGAPGIPSYNVDGSATGWQTLVGREATQTLTNKTLATPTITGIMTGIGSQSATTFMGSDTAVSSVAFTNLCNTGSIGAAGQTWLIMVTETAINTGAAAFVECAIFDGSTQIACVEGVTGGANLDMALSTNKVVVLTAATTFTLQSRSNGANTSAKTSTSNVTNKATSITAVRLA